MSLSPHSEPLGFDEKHRLRPGFGVHRSGGPRLARTRMAMWSMESPPDAGKMPLQRTQLIEKREENRTLLRFVRDAMLRQKKIGAILFNIRHWTGRRSSSRKLSQECRALCVTCACSASSFQMDHISGREQDCREQKRSWEM